MHRVLSLLASAALAGCSIPIAPTHLAAPPTPEEVTQRVFVRLDSTSPGAVLVDTRDGGILCAAPCVREVVVAEERRYEVHADGELPSEPATLYSKEDTEAWLVHEGNDPGLLWTYRTLTATCGGLGLGLIIAGGIANSTDLVKDHPDLPAALGGSGLVLAIPGTILFGVLTALQSDSDLEFRDPALPGFRF